MAHLEKIFYPWMDVTGPTQQEATLAAASCLPSCRPQVPHHCLFSSLLSPLQPTAGSAMLATDTIICHFPFIK